MIQTHIHFLGLTSTTFILTMHVTYKEDQRQRKIWKSWDVTSKKLLRKTWRTLEWPLRSTLRGNNSKILQIATFYPKKNTNVWSNIRSNIRSSLKWNKPTGALIIYSLIIKVGATPPGTCALIISAWYPDFIMRTSLPLDTTMLKIMCG